MTRFVAVPVRAGDAFYLERNEGCILVDGGISKSAFPELFRLHVNRDRADIVVCTHNDADHANGIIGFLEAGFTCREIWLPGRWLSVVKDVSQPAEMVIDEIVKGAIEYWKETSDATRLVQKSLEDVGATLSDPAPPELETTPLEGDKPVDWPDDVVKALEQAGAPPEAKDWEPWWKWHIPPPHGPLGNPPGFWRVVREAIDAAHRIRKIAQLAFDNGVPVRWFEHAPSKASGGIPGFLHPVSARQVGRVFPYRPLFRGLALTTVNKESLVLYSPPNTQSPGVLFCADSNLHSMNLPIQRRDLITVPHHGSEDNQSAYMAISSAVGSTLSSLTWVRSDSRTSQRPGITYRQLLGTKICTVCRAGPPKQRVIMIGRRGRWACQTGLRQCGC